MRLPPSRFDSVVFLLATTFVSPAVLGVQIKSDAVAQEQVDLRAIDKLSQADIAACLKDDVDTMCSLWTDDGVLLMPGATPLVGKKAICAMLQAQKAQSNGSKTTGYTEDWDEVRVVGVYAWQWGKMSQTQTDRSGKQQTMRVNAIRILQRQPEGSWKVVRAVVTLAAQ